MATQESNTRGPIVREWLSQGLESLIYKNRKDNRTSFDVVVVGSGYGGAVAAAGLAGLMRNGRTLSLCVLERGKEFVPGAFPSSITEVPTETRFTLPGHDQSGIGDPTFVLASNIFGQPAMDLQEYAAHFKSGKPVHESSLNWSLWVSAPTGKYEPASLVNAGENRLTIKPEINFMHIADKLWFEANAAVTFFTDNSDYLVTGCLEQEPLMTLEGHLSVDLPIRPISKVTIPAWASLSLYGYIGGETSVNGISRNDTADDWALSTNLYLRLHKQYAFRLFYTKTIKHEPGRFDTDTAGFRAIGVSNRTEAVYAASRLKLVKV